ncbi:MAG: M6 family metalloprotease domain-containing protein, partial [Muribaculaceae bacterium]|nr:M6 family metalloprotease domain-containing protein [Muribaculaceae bacterium]
TFPCHGSQRAIAILVEFPETQQHPQGRRFTSDSPRDLFDRLLNADDYAHDGATGSVRSYFRDNSNGVFDLTFDVFGPVTVSRDVKFYCEDELNMWYLVEEACRLVDDQVNFSDYDRDFDGVIDNIYIFYAGPGAATGGDPSDCIWQHASDVELLSGQQFLFDGVRLNHYACSNEYRDVKNQETGRVERQTEGIGTVCHEFSHVLGLPDLYDVNYAGNASPGAWDVMDTGCHLNESRTPAAFSALDRMLLGWLEPEEIGNTPRTLSLRSIDSNCAYRIPTASPEEYFLLENRQQTGWDAALPGHGLLVWRINYQADYWAANQVNTGRGSSHAIIVCADGHYGEGTYPSDPYPGTGKVTGLSDDGYPNMLSSRGERTNTPLSGITEAGGIISFDVCRTVTFLDKVQGLRASDVTPTAFTAEWDAIPMSPGYVVNVTTASGDHVGIYKDLNVAATSVRVSGLEPETDYLFTVRGVAGAVSGEVSDPCAVSTPAMSFAFMAPQSLDIKEVGSNAFRAQWRPMEDAVDYALTVMTVRQGADRMVAVDFTGGIEALPAGWSTNCISTMSIKGYYGKTAPALSMGADYARIQSPLLDHELLSVEFWYRERTPSGQSSLGIEVLTGSEWKEIDRVALDGSMSTGATYAIDPSQIPAGAMAVRLIYHRIDKGSLAVDDVKITYRGEDEATPIEGWSDRRLESDATEAEVASLEPEKEYYCYVRGIDRNGVMSAASDMVSVTTLTGSALETVEDAVEAGEYRLYDLQGRPVDASVPARGIYILKNNKETKKLIYE